MVAQARDTEETLKKAGTECRVPCIQESLAYVIRVAYGQVVFTPRHDAFTQSTYLQRLHFGCRKQLPFPEGGPSYQVHGPGDCYLAPLPQAYAVHAAEFAETQKESVRLIYREMLDA